MVPGGIQITIGEFCNWLKLNEAQVRYIVIGGQAMLQEGMPQFSKKLPPGAHGAWVPANAGLRVLFGGHTLQSPLALQAMTFKKCLSEILISEKASLNLTG